MVYTYASEKPINALYPVSQKFPSRYPWNDLSVRLRLINYVPFSSVARKIVQRLPFSRKFSPLGDRPWDVPGFAPAGTVSSSSTLPIFRLRRKPLTRVACSALQSVSSVISLHFGLSRAEYIHRSFCKVDVKTHIYAIWVSPEKLLFLIWHVYLYIIHC